ncbi:hypothetical protein [Vallitalea sp.]|jgi:hypothetical protein|uniref:hypothetical protein n=1 Tax=Vallitalea sp. TaxID=1882829 RepID=UPI0025D79C39|nr:hypothetical protein [Vallitalea sp.]MCT4688357.1 hypothetical protein [Vallitalea sp.]
MKKINKLLIVSFSFLFVMTGCNSKDKSLFLDSDNIIKDIQFVEEKNEKLHIDTNILPNIKNGEIFDYSYVDDKIYYIVVYDSFSEYVNDIDIYCYNIKDKNTSLIYNYHDDNINKFMCDLRATKEYLFWIDLYGDKPYWRLNKMTLADGEIDIIRKYEDSNSTSPPAISISKNWVSWYELPEGSEDIYTDNNLLLYSIKDDSVILLQEKVYRASPYYEAPICDNFITYLTANKDKTLSINQYNLDTKETFEINTNSDIDERYIIDYMSNGSYIVWHDGNYKTLIEPHLFVHDLKLCKTYQFNTDNKSVLCSRIYSNYIMVKYNNHIDNNLYFYDLEGFTKINVSNYLDNESIDWLRNSTDNYVTSQFYDKDDTGIIRIN